MARFPVSAWRWLPSTPWPPWILLAPSLPSVFGDVACVAVFAPSCVPGLPAKASSCPWRGSPAWSLPPGWPGSRPALASTAWSPPSRPVPLLSLVWCSLSCGCFLSASPGLGALPCPVSRVARGAIRRLLSHIVTWPRPGLSPVGARFAAWLPSTACP